LSTTPAHIDVGAGLIILHINGNGGKVRIPSQKGIDAQ
jgi:hypothetical protein